MHLVDYINSVLSTYGSIISFFTKVTDIVNTVVTCGIYLDNIKYCTGINTAANFTLVTRITVNRMLAIYSLGKDFGTACFTRTSCTCEKVGIGKFTCLKLITERYRNM